MPEFSHEPVMLGECMDALQIKPDGVYIDCTAGGGGHSAAIIKRLTTGKLIALDRDNDAINAISKRLGAYADRLVLIHDNFANIAVVMDGLHLTADGALFDLGVSSYQLDTAERGFSYMSDDAPLDMRMNSDDKLTAYDVINSYDKNELTDILYKYGEEKFAPRIASFICERRITSPILTTSELVGIIKDAIPAKARETGHHPAKRAFQAVRIEVNGELNVIAPAIKAVVERMNSGGRAAVITFHSLEDRIAKQTFADLARGCVCPPNFPVCVCGQKPIVKLIGRKPSVPSDEETERNPRSRSAKLRVAEKI
jgi:16S rRNA (cytosine1402-N4)-methyltransferase